MSESTVNGLAWHAPEALARAVSDEIAAWKKDGRMARLWARDASLWADQDEAKWLGWLDAIGREQKNLDKYRALAEEVRAEKFLAERSTPAPPSDHAAPASPALAGFLAERSTPAPPSDHAAPASPALAGFLAERSTPAPPSDHAAPASPALAGFTHALLLGMGGSSLGPEVLAMTFGKQAGFPELHVLDSTVPAQVRAVESRVDLARTLVIVASKSGSTLEPNVFKQYFFGRMARAVGEANAGRHFVAITDPGSKMQKVAEGDGFRHIFFGEPTIGGRYSALSPFGLVPAAVIGLDVEAFLASTARMAAACGASVEGDQNPGLVLGALLGVAATQGRDKLTLIASPGIISLGAWLEQLIAESTGKDGKAIVPVDLEPLGDPARYGADRVFAYLRLTTAPDAAQDALADALMRAGQPVVRIDVADTSSLGQEFFRWEIATAVAGAVLKINPFNQPDVEASKIATRELTTAYERDGRLPAETPLLSGNGFMLFTDGANADALQKAAPAGTVESYLAAHFARLQAGDYLALLAYVAMNPRHAAILQRIRAIVRERRGVATCLGFGPRFLHSTGQAYKGGPGSGVFLQITSDDDADVSIPDQRYSFGVVKSAQARGDFDVLAERGRRALRVHVGADVAEGLQQLCDIVERLVGA